MKIAIPLAGDKLTIHFGHCDQFALIDVDPANKTVTKRVDVVPPPHQPGLLPPWLAKHGVNLVIAGGMGQKAIALLQQQGVDVIIGAPVETPERLVADYLADALQAGSNSCDH